MAKISRRELIDDVAEVLSRVEAGEELTITASDRPVAVFGPPRARHWVPSSQLADLWGAPGDPSLEADLNQARGLSDASG